LLRHHTTLNRIPDKTVLLWNFSLFRVISLLNIKSLGAYIMQTST
jgi:hypothetical protein